MPQQRFLKAGIKVSLLVILCISCSSCAKAQTDGNRNFNLWLENMRAEALARGISQDTVNKALRNVNPMRRVLKRDRNQSEFKLTLARYKKRVITPQNIKTGRKKSLNHADLFNHIEKRYGVQRRFILAIWGIETRFGQVKADLPVIPAVATLAFDRRRSNYFKAQIFAVLRMLENGYVSQKQLRGSWAGAMGQPQFMPSSYLAYAVDFDGDGRRDIWKNTGDVLASIANYLAKHGWNNNLTWGREVILSSVAKKSIGALSTRAAPGCRALTSKRKFISIWQKHGVRRIDGSSLSTKKIKGAIVFPDGKIGKIYLVYKNYSSIMSYNCAHLYGITVGLFSDLLG